MHDGSHAFLISGCRTYGVLGSAKAFLEPNVAAENIKFLEARFGRSDFVVVFHTRVISNRVIPTRLDLKVIRALYSRSESNTFKKVIV
jgi:hypothetical protein